MQSSYECFIISIDNSKRVGETIKFCIYLINLMSKIKCIYYSILKLKFSNKIVYWWVYFLRQEIDQSVFEEKITILFNHKES